MLDDDLKIKYMIGKVLGEGGLKAFSVATYAAWPAEAVALLYIFMKKYHKEKNGIAGFSREELENDVIWADTQIKKLKKERSRVKERIKRLSQKKDAEAKASLTTAEIELKSREKQLEDFIGRKEFDKLLLIMLDHREQLEKSGVWKELQAPKKFVKRLDKEQKRIEKSEISFGEFSGYLRMKLEDALQ